MIEILVAVTAVVGLGGLMFFTLNSIREGQRMERTLVAIHTLKEQVKKNNHYQGSYTLGPMLPVLFATNSFPDTLTIDYEKRTVSTPIGYPLDIVGRGANFSIELYDMTPDDCYSLGEDILRGNFFMLGNASDDFVMMQIGKMSFDDAHLLTYEALENACTQSFSIDAIMAFR